MSQTENEFDQKWAAIKQERKGKEKADEKELFVCKGMTPKTQRQLNLYYYFQFIQKILKKESAKRVIEVGCGRGTIGLYVRSYLGMDVTLLDSSESAIVLAKRQFSQAGEEASFVVGDATATGLTEGEMDAVVSIGLAEHLDDVDKLFAEEYRLLKPGGVMISLNIPKKFSVQSLNTVYRWIRKIFGTYKEGVHKDYYRNTYSAKQYKQFAEQVGFENTEITHVCPYPIYTPLSLDCDKKITKIRKMGVKVRSWFGYPYKTNRLRAQAHFLVAYKPKA